MKFSILILVGLFGLNSAAPVKDDCVTSEKVKLKLLDSFNKQLGKVFADDFSTAYDNTVSVSSRNTTGCFREDDLKFVCEALYLLYETRVPEAVVLVSEDCSEIGKALYH
ncbi:hypothetical protein HPULCUR_003586 [Helicostylum pulchrum]|uniref:Uncharacterized protein n=1 Tax=Helicostylum pulchrum TaxID=562976 RepID=A0ABP9XTT0_9FUNG